MSWNDLNPEDLAQVSYPEMGSRMTIRREPGVAKIIARELPEGRKKVLFLRVPEELHERLEDRVIGPMNTAVVAILDETLDRLDGGNTTWRVIAPAIKSKKKR